MFNTQNGFTAAKINGELFIFYYDEETGKFTSPDGILFKEP
jgi:hypothetical protein